MGQTDRGNVVPLTETIGPLLFSVVPGSGVISVASVVHNGSKGLLLIPYVAFFGCVTAVLLVLPVFALLPRMRRPTYPLAAIWGVAVAWIAASVILFGNYSRAGFLSEVLQWGFLLGYGLAGATSGLLYSYAARRKCSL